MAPSFGLYTKIKVNGGYPRKIKLRVNGRNNVQTTNRNKKFTEHSISFDKTEIKLIPIPLGIDCSAACPLLKNFKAFIR